MKDDDPKHSLPIALQIINELIRVYGNKTYQVLPKVPNEEEQYFLKSNDLGF